MYQITADLILVMTAAPTPLVRQNVHFLCIDCKLSNFLVEDCDESVHLPVYCQFTFRHKNYTPHIGDKPQSRPSQNNSNFLHCSDQQKENFLTHFHYNLTISKRDIFQQINKILIQLLNC